MKPKKGYKFVIGDDGKVRKLLWDTKEGYVYMSCYAKDLHKLNKYDPDSRIFILSPPTAEELVDEVLKEERK